MSEPTSPPAGYPTAIRWSVVAVATLMSTLMYLDRFCIAFAQSLIQEDLGLTSEQVPWIISAFFLSYSLSQIPSGWLSDMWGGRIMLTIYILSWSLFVLFVGLSTSFWFLLAMQLGHGVGQAGAYPTSAGLLSRWMPLGSRGMASSIVAFGGRLGGWLQPILTAWLIVFFVPTEKSSLLTPRQLIQSGIGAASARLVANEQQPDSSAAGYQAALLQSIWDKLPADSRAILAPIATQQRAYDTAKTATPADPDLKPPTFVLSTKDAELLAAGINSTLSVPDLASAQSVVGLKLAREAEALMARRDNGQTLTSAETERLNRLVWEALFPGFIGKVYVQGWRSVLTAYAAVGILVSLLFWIIVRNRPQDHPWCNTRELELIEAGRTTSVNAAVASPKLKWSQVLRSRALWLSSISQFGTNIGWLFVMTQFPTYLEQVHQVEILQRGFMSSLPPAGGIVGMLLGGRLTDWLRWKWGVRWGRAIPMGMTRFGAAAAYLSCLFASDPWIATIACVFVSFFTDLGVAATWAFVQDAGGRYVGVVLGFGNMWGNFGATVAPQIYNYTLKWTHNDWNICFVLCAVAFIISGIAGIFIDASQPIVEDDPQPAAA